MRESGLAKTLAITEAERAIREDGVKQALASVRLEGLEPGADVRAIHERYIDGELTLEQAGAEIKALHDRKFGPVSLSGNRRS